MVRKIIVIGSGAAGMTAASNARTTDPKAEITVITEDTDVAYSPCMIPWVIEGKSTWEGMIMHTPEWYDKERDISVITETRVESVDGDGKTVNAGGKDFPYDSLVIATGGKVFIPPVDGKKLPGVFVVRTVNDGRAIQECMANIDKVVIAGAGVIGLELAVAMVGAGKDVTVIEMMDQVIPRIADADMARPVQEYLESKGVKFVLKAPVGSVNGKNRVESVTALGVEYPCGMVVFATGVRANRDIAVQLGYDIGQLGAVAVSPTMQPYKRGRLVPDVYLAGDVVQCQSAVFPGPTMSQLGSSAVKEGIVAGRNAAGGNAEFGAVLSPWVSVLGEQQIAGTGMSLGLASWYGADVAVGKAEGLSCARYYPGAESMTVKLIGDRTSRRIIGAQILGRQDITGRIDWLTSVILSGMTAETFVTEAENAYCPPTSMVRDPVMTAAEDLSRALSQ